MLLAEAFNIDDVIPKAAKPADLFLGRLQPPHNGHAKIINSMKNGIVAIVKGVLSSQDKSKNPLPYEYQKKLVNEISPETPVIEVPTGYLPDIINEVRKLGKEVGIVYAGSDRIQGYQRQVDQANAKLSADKKFNVTFKESERVTSATTVRDAIRSGNQTAFRTNVPKAIWGEYETLRDYLKEDTNMKSFAQFFKESMDPASTSAIDDTNVALESRDDGGDMADSGGRSFSYGDGGRTDQGYSGGRSFDYGEGGRTDTGRNYGGRSDEDASEAAPGDVLPEAVDPIDSHLAGGRSDSNQSQGATPPSDKQLIHGPKPGQQDNTQNFLKKIQ
jgi:phosphopantetheine adenylyltransferase